jgi:hypothetical protein
MNFDTLAPIFALTGSTLSSPAPASATPLPVTDWGNNGPGTLIDNFSVRWKGRFNFLAAIYTFSTNSDDGSRAYFDDNNDGSPDSGYLVNDWSDHGPQLTAGSPVTVTAGQHTLVYEMYENGGGAGYGLSWTSTPIPVNASVSIDANPKTDIPYNTSSTLTWSYSKASSCTITPPATIGGYPSGSGSVSTGNLTTGRTYTITCDPGAVNSSVAVTVLPQPKDINVIKTGKGIVTSNPLGINCGIECTGQTATFPPDVPIVLTAEAGPGRIFTGWSGGTCSGIGLACTISAGSTDVTAIANFAVKPNYEEF